MSNLIITHNSLLQNYSLYKNKVVCQFPFSNINNVHGTIIIMKNQSAFNKIFNN